MAQDSVPPLPTSNSNAKGCIIGCLIVFVIGVVGAGIAAYGIYSAGKGALVALDSVTESEPRALPEFSMSDEETQVATEKFKRFTGAVESGAADEKTFSFTGPEINGMLRSNESVRILGESVYVTIEDGEVNGEVSFNLGDIIPLPFFEGRYANGSATFSVSASDGRLSVFIEDFQMKGEPAPPEILAQLRQKNLAEDFSSDPELRKMMENIDSISVQGDQLFVMLK